MPDNWVPSDPASPQEIGKALLINGPGMNDPITRAYLQRLQGQQGLTIEDMVRGTSPAPPPVAPPQGPSDLSGLFGVPAHHLTRLAGDVVQGPLPKGWGNPYGMPSPGSMNVFRPGAQGWSQNPNAIMDPKVKIFHPGDSGGDVKHYPPLG